MFGRYGTEQHEVIIINDDSDEEQAGACRFNGRGRSSPNGPAVIDLTGDPPLIDLTGEPSEDGTVPPRILRHLDEPTYRDLRAAVAGLFERADSLERNRKSGFFVYDTQHIPHVVNGDRRRASSTPSDRWLGRWFSKNREYMGRMEHWLAGVRKAHAEGFLNVGEGPPSIRSSSEFVTLIVVHEFTDITGVDRLYGVGRGQ